MPTYAIRAEGPGAPLPVTAKPRASTVMAARSALRRVEHGILLARAGHAAFPRHKVSNTLGSVPIQVVGTNPPETAQPRRSGRKDIPQPKSPERP